MVVTHLFGSFSLKGFIVSSVIFQEFSMYLLIFCFTVNIPQPVSDSQLWWHSSVVRILQKFSMWTSFPNIIGEKIINIPTGKQIYSYQSIFEELWYYWSLVFYMVPYHQRLTLKLLKFFFFFFFFFLVIHSLSCHWNKVVSLLAKLFLKML